MHWPVQTVLLVLLLLSAGCENRSNSKEPAASAAVNGGASSLSGTIVMLTNRIDLIENGTFKGYADQFKKKYPEANVEFEGLSNYASDILVRLSTKDAGDVLLLPVNLPAKELELFLSRWIMKCPPRKDSPHSLLTVARGTDYLQVRQPVESSITSGLSSRRALRKFRRPLNNSTQPAPS